MRTIKIKLGVGWAALAVALAFLSGCALLEGINPEKTDPQPQPQPTATAITENAAVTLLNDTRDGFIITETVKMDSALRKDFERAVAMLDEAQDEQAIALLEKIIEQSPGVTAPYINLGIAYQRTDKAEKAEAQFKKALELMPGHPVACNQYGLLCRKAGRFAEARTIYELALNGYPNYYPVHRNLGILCDLYISDPEAALAHFQIYSQAMPEDDKVKLWIADLQARLGIEQGEN